MSLENIKDDQFSLRNIKHVAVYTAFRKENILISAHCC